MGLTTLVLAAVVIPADAAAGSTATPLPSALGQYTEPASASPSPTPTTSSPTPTTSPSPSRSAGATPTPSPSPSTSSSSPAAPTATPTPFEPPPPPGPDGGHAEPDHPAPLSGVVLQAQIAEAARISAILESSSSEVAAAMKRMDVLSDRSNATLESLAAATDTEKAARQEARDARADLVTLEARLTRARAVVKDWVFDVYSGGGDGADISGMLDAMQSGDADAGNPLGDLAYITDQRTRALAEVRTLTAEQKRLTAAAVQAEDTAAKARARIERDKDRLDALMKVQQARIGELRKLQMAEVDQAGPIANALVGARTPEAQAAATRLRAALSGSVVETADVGKPCSDDSGEYPNGLFPGSALCPVWGSPGERLAPDAAASFNALSKAYAAQTGTPLCVTDSYRSLSEQVSVKSTRGAFAATPGTSRHGLGRAVDMCGGVESFGSPAHEWMRVNAPLYGWFHPAWADAGGPLPEPWHFEYAG
ncbi:M15 family metallopeptidase [Phycicoccus flavus]|uniref:D-alanyl-D-alanine carboxypeptidase-like core domain-containing protein n=1 Tax=Phycicoccus flavus TaxID=2502783 RepID=A0A8T6R673_9MICO|nr:M15 family metallopeptidase [Phycicoccus flavus]NHA68325.1 hypothetical protein [Phycicoccus flavus]